MTTANLVHEYKWVLYKKICVKGPVEVFRENLWVCKVVKDPQDPRLCKKEKRVDEGGFPPVEGEDEVVSLGRGFVVN